MPTLTELESDAEYGRVNLQMLRNPTVANLLDGCSISLPCHAPGTAPVGLMLIAGHSDDHRLLAISSCIEGILNRAHEAHAI
jgi:aspartyl-tRNA(Asn)/glutamyl-tRNA(Gln) amidotransferase subunit A